MTRARLITGLILAAAILAPCAVAGFTPIHSSSHDQIFTIPKGTWARRMSGGEQTTLLAHS